MRILTFFSLTMAPHDRTNDTRHFAPLEMAILVYFFLSIFARRATITAFAGTPIEVRKRKEIMAEEVC